MNVQERRRYTQDAFPAAEFSSASERSPRVVCMTKRDLLARL
jgi:hypothetical protein